MIKPVDSFPYTWLQSKPGFLGVEVLEDFWGGEGAVVDLDITYFAVKPSTII